MAKLLYRLNLTDEEGRLQVVNLLGVACWASLLSNPDLYSSVLCAGWMALYGFCQWLHKDENSKTQKSGKEVEDLKTAVKTAMTELNKLKLRLGFGPRSDMSVGA